MMSASLGNKLSWLIGKWKGKGCGIYPDMKPFEYVQELEFSNDGIPFIVYKSRSWDTEEHEKPMHWESGFIRFNPESKTAAFILAQNVGLTEILEGETSDEQQIHLKSPSESIGRMSFSVDPHVRATERVYKSLGPNRMEHKFFMATENQPLSLHLHITYERV